MEMSDDGEIHAVERARLEHDKPEAMRKWLARLDPEIPVALEATFGWPWVADLLESLGHTVHLGHPPGIRALSVSEPKSDRCDGDRLGRFELRGILPRSYLAPPDVRAIRERVRYRMALVVLCSGIKSRVHAILHRRGILNPCSDLFGKRGRAFLETLNLPASSLVVLRGYLDLIDLLTRLIEQVELWMAENLVIDETVRLLSTIPGIGLILAHVIRAEVGEIERFCSPGRLAKYSGLAPVSRDTAGHEGPRHCSPACNHTLRWAFIEAVHGVQKTTGSHALRLRLLYARLCGGGRGKKGQKSLAKIAVAREISELVHVVWTKRVPYTDYPPPRPGSRDGQEQPKAPTAKTTLRPDQSRHPMARRQPKAAG